MHAATSILVIERPGLWRAELAAAMRASGYVCEELDPPDRAGSESFERRLRSSRIDAAIVGFGRSEEAFVLERLAEAPSSPAILAIVSSSRPALGVCALKAGADEILRKPFRLAALELRLSRLLDARSGGWAAGQEEPFVTADPHMRSLLAELRDLAQCDVTIQIIGEAGTGRRLLARHIHALSGRCAAAIVELDCALLAGEAGPGDLLRGSSTERAIPGVPAGGIAAADRGTLLLHEVAELPWRLQSGLLRVLQAGESVTDAPHSRAPDLRLISSGRRPLLDEMESGRLRRELGYRLDVVALRVPPLRERPGDIALLAQHLLDRIAAELGCERPRLRDEACRALATLPLPGNARDLERLMRRAALLFPGADVDFERLTSGSPRGERILPSSAVDTLNLRELERRTILRSLAEADGNRTRASRALGISTRTLRNKIREYGVA